LNILYNYGYKEGIVMEDEIKVGSQLNKIRKEKGFSIAKLSTLSGVSTGLISQIEREMVVPSVVSLWRLAKALDADISYFFDEETHNDRQIIRSGEHRKIITEKGTASYEMLGSNANDRMLDMCIVRLSPGEEYDENDLATHEGEECGYVVEGVLTVHFRDTDYTLNKGDSIYFKSAQPHKYLNLSATEECVSVWSMTPHFF